jgi:hypothetical protein
MKTPRVRELYSGFTSKKAKSRSNSEALDAPLASGKMTKTRQGESTFLTVPPLWAGKPTLIETAQRMGFYDQALPMQLTLPGSQTMNRAADAHDALLQLQRSYLA